MTEEVTIKLRTEVEGTEDVEKYRGQMGQVQKQTENATRSAQKAGKEISASALNVSKLTQNLGKLSPTLGKIAQGVNRMTASWKKYDAQAKKIRKGDLTNMPNQLGDKSASKASKIGTGAKIAGVALGATALSMIFNAITGSGSKLAGFDKLNTLGSPSILDPILPYLKDIDENTEKTADNTKPLKNPSPYPDYNPYAGQNPSLIPTDMREHEKLTKEMLDREAEYATSIGYETWSNIGKSAEKNLNNVKGIASETFDPIIEDANSIKNITDSWFDIPLNSGMSEYMDGLIIKGMVFKGIMDIDSKARQSEKTKTPDKDSTSSEILGNPNNWTLKPPGKNGTSDSMVIPDGFYLTPSGTVMPEGNYNSVSQIASLEDGQYWMTVGDKQYALGNGGGLFYDQNGNPISRNTPTTPIPAPAKSKEWWENITDPIGEAYGGMADFIGGLIPEDWAQGYADKVNEGNKKLEELSKGYLPYEELSAKDVQKAYGEAGRDVALEALLSGLGAVSGVVLKTASKTVKSADEIVDGLKKGLSDKDFVIVDDVAESASKATPKIKKGGLSDKDYVIVDEMEETVKEVAKNAEKSSSNFKSKAKKIAKWGVEMTGLNMAVNALGGLFGFAEGGVFLPNQPQLAVLGDNKSEPEVAAPYSLIVKAVGDAIKSNQGATSLSGPTKIEVPISLNGKVIARAVYDDLESERRRRNGSVVL